MGAGPAARCLGAHPLLAAATSPAAQSGFALRLEEGVSDLLRVDVEDYVFRPTPT